MCAISSTLSFFLAQEKHLLSNSLGKQSGDLSCESIILMFSGRKDMSMPEGWKQIYCLL